MLTKQTTLVGAGALVVGSIFGHILSGPGGAAKRNIEELQNARSAMSEEIASLGETRAALTEQIAQLTSGQTSLTDQLNGFGGQITELKDAAGARAEEVTASLSELSAGFSAFKDDVGARFAEITAPAAAPAAPEPSASAAPAPAEANAAPQTDGVMVAGPGQTARLSDNLRVFLGRVDADGGAVSAAINGLSLARLRLNQPVGVTADGVFCHVTLNGFGGNGASFSHLCGEDVPAPVGLRTGETRVFDDHSVRAFVSRVDIAEQQAVIAVNGLETQTIGYDTPLKVNAGGTRCNLSLNNIDRGHADLALNC